MMWYFMCFRGECSFDSYTLSLDNPGYFYECSSYKVYESKCPDMYSEWKLSKDCEWGPVSFVYYYDAVFRNYFCAICNPSYNLEYSEIVTDDPLEDLFIGSVQVSQSSVITTVKLSSWQCCGRCVQDPQPVCSEIDNSTSVLSELILKELVNSTVFENSFLLIDLCGNEMHQCFEIKTDSFPNSRISVGWTSDFTQPYLRDFQTTLMPDYTSKSKSIGGAVFSVARYPHKKKTTSVQMWRSSNDSIMFCSNKSVISQLSNQAYKQIQLSANGLQVGFLLVFLSHSLPHNFL